MNPSRAGHSATVLKKSWSILVCGGVNDTRHHSCQLYDMDTDTWDEFHPMLFDRLLFGLSSSKGRVLAFGGFVFPSNFIEEFDERAGIWVDTGSKLPHERTAFATVLW